MVCVQAERHEMAGCIWGSVKSSVCWNKWYGERVGKDDVGKQEGLRI